MDAYHLEDNEITNIRSSWQYVLSDEGARLYLFYEKLFETAPEVQVLFKSDQKSQIEKLLYTLTFVLKHLDKLDHVKETIEDLGRLHRDLEIAPKYYAHLIDAWVETLKIYMAEKYTNEVGEAWRKILSVMSVMMIDSPDKKETLFEKLMSRFFNA